MIRGIKGEMKVGGKAYRRINEVILRNMPRNMCPSRQSSHRNTMIRINQTILFGFVSQAARR